MSQIRKERAEHRALHKKPKNVTVIVDGTPKVIPYKEYEEKYLKEEPVEKFTGDIDDTPI